MISETSIRKSIKSGWERAYSFSVLATEEWSTPFKPEYLATTMIAEKISDHYSAVTSSYVTKLEAPTQLVFKNCFPPFKIGHWRSFQTQYRQLVRLKARGIRTGKFDIAVFDRNAGGFHDWASKVVVEVKNFNPPRNQIQKELVRIDQLLRFTDPIGPSSFETGFITFCNDYSKVFLKNGIKGIIRKHSKKLNWITQMPLASRVNRSIFLLSKEVDIDEEGALNNYHCFIGTTLTIKR